MPRLKKGDRVIALRDHCGVLTAGRTYELIADQDEEGYSIIRDGGHTGWFFATRFRHAPPLTPLQAAVRAYIDRELDG